MSIAVVLPLLLLATPLAAQETQPNGEQGDRVTAQKLLEMADEVIGQVEGLRRREFKRAVDKGVHSEKELRGFIEKALFEEELGEGKLERLQWMLTEMGLLPKAMDLKKTIIDVLMNQVGGFYDPKRSAFFMMLKTAKYGEVVNQMLIAHELTHALDDQHYGLEAGMKEASKTEDRGFAFGSVVEGSATALMTRWMAKHAMDKLDMSEMKKLAESEMERSKAFLESPPYFWTLLAKYVIGMNFLTKGKGQLWLARGAPHDGVGEMVDKALREPPTTSEQILHPDKYWDAEAFDAPVLLANQDELVTAIEAALASQLVSTDSLGEIHCGILARKAKRKLNMGAASSTKFWTNRASEGWGGDLVLMLGKGDDDGKKSIVWITYWDSAADAKQFDAAYRRHYGEALGMGSAVSGRIAVYTYGAASDSAAELLEIVVKKGKPQKGTVPFAIQDDDDGR